MKNTIILSVLAFSFISVAAIAQTIPDEKHEAVALKSYPTLAKRTKAELLIYKNGKKLHGFKKVDCEYQSIDDDCVTTSFFGAINLFNPKTSKIEAYPVVFNMGYEWYNYEIWALDKEKVEFDATPSASPDGKTIATGFDTMDGMTGGGGLTFYDIKHLEDPTIFEIPCQPLKWADNATLKVKCSVPNEVGYSYFYATAAKDAAKKWKIVPDKAVGNIQKVYYPSEGN